LEHFPTVKFLISQISGLGTLDKQSLATARHTLACLLTCTG